MLGGRANRRPLRVASMLVMLAVALVGTSGSASGAWLPAPPADRLAYEVRPGFGDLDTAGIGGEFAIVFPQDATVSWFVDTFGMRKPSGRRHLGEDIFGPKMSAVYAVADGIVSHLGSSGRAGNYLVLEHADGWESWYIHLNDDTPGTDDGDAERDHVYAPGIEEGAFVRAGDLIAYVGDSGNAEGAHPHTHFELYHRGELVDPYPYLVSALERARIVADLERLKAAPGEIG